MDEDGGMQPEIGSISHFEQAVTDVRAFLAERDVTVSRLQLRRAIIVYSTKEKLSPVNGAREVQQLLAKRVLSLAELIALE